MTAAPRIDRGFSLTEVIIALGIFAFCIVALINLLAVGIRTTGQSQERLEAANTAQELLEMRRLYPTNLTSSGSNVPVNLANWGLPEIKTTSLPVIGEVPIAEDGTIVSATSPEAVYWLNYRLTTNALSTNCVNVFLSLAPVHSSDKVHTSDKLRTYELVSSISL